MASQYLAIAVTRQLIHRNYIEQSLLLDTVPFPEPGYGELWVKLEATPLNLNALERIMAGKMMVGAELPYSAGMEVIGVVDACGEGVEDRLGKRDVAITSGAHGGFAQYALCTPVSAFEMPESLALPAAAQALADRQTTGRSIILAPRGNE